jgi:hypothetical protein
MEYSKDLLLIVIPKLQNSQARQLLVHATASFNLFAWYNILEYNK